ncbi:hypothetical protein GWK47_019053 [Chionoecetes opilio]|uniref:Uncharacterized protein n=1 Tax=Chionoecetes opilio TaxID=41210 RepID=A0A8J5CJ41_CHIOP|nr:hypothetical protein GWK47_019053 [Chionoecetes opilio]
MRRLSTPLHLSSRGQVALGTYSSRWGGLYSMTGLTWASYSRMGPSASSRCLTRRKRVREARRATVSRWRFKAEPGVKPSTPRIVDGVLDGKGYHPQTSIPLE